jgi:two-component system, chemotaxis family, chemotaxis protein CheY
MTITTPVILIVEDELPLLEAIVLKARMAGFEAVSARGVAEAKEFLNSIPSIDVVWLDHFLPEQVGLELVKFMRQDPKWKTTPIFLVTNAVEPEIVNQYMKAGINGYYTKILVGLHDVLRDIKSRLAAPAGT